MNKIFFGKIRSGKLRLDNKNLFTDFVMSQKDCAVEMVLRKPKKQRSIPQNSYYWGVIVKLLSEHLGYYPEEIHGIIKFKFVYTKDEDSTRDLSTYEFSEFTEQIIEWAAQEFNLVIPYPNEVEVN